MCQPQSPNLSTPTPGYLYACSVPLCLCFCPADKIIYHFSRFRIYRLIYDVCLPTPHPWLNSAWQTLVPSCLLEWASFLPFDGRVILHYVHASHPLHLLIFQWTIWALRQRQHTFRIFQQVVILKCAFLLSNFQITYSKLCDIQATLLAKVLEE